jgi:hypothetical protein
VKTIADLPGWWHGGSNPTAYEIGRDQITKQAGVASARLKATQSNPAGFASMMQVCAADRFRGKRLRLSGWLKTENVGRRAGFWLRVDGLSAGKSVPLAVDAMKDRPILGSHDWSRYEIVLDVGRDAVDIAFGATLAGAGTVWVDGLQLDEVSAQVAPAGVASGVPALPKNLDFEGADTTNPRSRSNGR